MESNIEKQILLEAKGLPETALDEVLHFIQFLKTKWSQKTGATVSDNLTDQLQQLDIDEWDHLDKEMKDYKKIYPHVQ